MTIFLDTYAADRSTFTARIDNLDRKKEEILIVPFAKFYFQYIDDNDDTSWTLTMKRQKKSRFIIQPIFNFIILNILSIINHQF